MSKSGGITARNTREGFRSEYFAQYIFSSFGTSVIVGAENDLGIDLLCNLTEFTGKYIKYKSTYGVQVKSEGAPFKYKGKEATEWLANLEFPLLLAEVSKKDSSIKIYSTWNLNRFILNLNTEDPEFYPEEINFDIAEDGELKEPKSSGLIPIGKPILHFKVNDLSDDKLLGEYRSIMSEWLEFENENYLLRRSGISTVFGYTNWETNKSLSSSNRSWYRPSFYSPHHTDKIEKLLGKAMVPLGLYYKKNYDSVKSLHFKEKYNDLRNYVNKHLLRVLDDFGKVIFKDSIDS